MSGTQDGSAGQQIAAREPPPAHRPRRAARDLGPPAHDENPPLIVQNPPIMTKTRRSWRILTARLDAEASTGSRVPSRALPLYRYLERGLAPLLAIIDLLNCCSGSSWPPSLSWKRPDAVGKRGDNVGQQGKVAPYSEISSTAQGRCSDIRETGKLHRPPSTTHRRVDSQVLVPISALSNAGL